ncbi:hypothetical protein M0534_06765 [Methylonatrum kenyense]|uniref:hypothetical protein n=1 Tax=Methylonatrum kenyense TaxID=455253 RepID=UPI0020BD67DF|nr:hypothetical protein [Methylonatrum kenyense]MCK8516026.1 hypothetical protein [Methylonatrum kenyense]
MSAHCKCLDGKVFFLTGVALAYLAHSGSAAAATPCDIALTAEEPEDVELEYDPFDLERALGTTRITISNNSDQTCPVVLELITGGDRSRVARLDNLGTQAEIVMAGTSDGMRGSGRGIAFDVPAADSTEVELEVLVAAGAYPRPGNYQDTVRFQLRDAESNRFLSEELPLRIATFVPARAQINIAGSSGPFGERGSVNQIDFGTLQSGLRRDVVVQVRSNSEYQVSMRSENNGRLVHEDDPQLPSIPYTVQLGRQRFDLAAPGQKQMPRPSSIRGTSTPLVFEIGQVGNVFAGQYRDTVEVSVRALY